MVIRTQGVTRMTKKILQVYDKTSNDIAEIIAEHLTVSESVFIRWYTDQFRIQFENNLKKELQMNDNV